MIAKRHPLIFKNFLVFKHQYEHIHTETIYPDVSVITDNYEIDIDFLTFIDNNNIDYYINLTIQVNNGENKLVGHSILITGLGVFNFDPILDLTEQEKMDFLYNSGLALCIGEIRALIYGITAVGVFGKYLLPTIDTGLLLSEKFPSTDTKKTSIP